jgi:hypothetical protein
MVKGFRCLDRVCLTNEGLFSYNTGNMKHFLLVIVAALSLLSGQARAQDDTVSPAISDADAELNVLYTPQGAENYVNAFFLRVGSGLTCASSSAFVPKELAGGHYLVAKLWVTDNHSGQQLEKGFVIDEDSGWIQTLPPSEYRRFLKSGNKAYLHEKILDPNS